VTESAELKGLRLLKAIREGDLPRCRALIAAGADPNASHADEWLPLHVAALEETPEITRLLLDAGADIAARCGKGRWTALHIAVSYGHEQTARLLLERGADIEAKAGKDFRPLHVAAYCGRANTVGLLLDHGADANAVAEDGRNAAAWAERQGHEETVQEIAKAISLRHADRVKALAMLRKRKAG